MKSPFRKSAPAKCPRPGSRKIRSKRGPTVRSDQRGLHLIGLRQSTRQRRGESLGDFAYRTIREAIRSGKFRSGEHLREADVAKWLNISRTPVREAFHRIISEGLLTNGPWNGVMVADLDSQQLVQLYAVRAALEGTAAALAAQHATKTEVQRLFQIASCEARAKNDPAKLVIINSELHQMLYAAAHNRYLLQSITTVVDALGLLRHSTFVLPGSIELAHREHLQIIKAIRDRKSAQAERLAREHVNHALAMRLDLQRLRSGGGA
jgi:DNA-binding GntR family transcriptional regulator